MDVGRKHFGIPEHSGEWSRLALRREPAELQPDSTSLVKLRMCLCQISGLTFYILIFFQLSMIKLFLLSFRHLTTLVCLSFYTFRIVESFGRLSIDWAIKETCILGQEEK